MKATKVTYLKTFPLGQFINEKIGIEIELNEGDDIQSALAFARSECELNHKTNNAHLYKDQETTMEQDPVVIWGEPLRKTEPQKLSQKELIISEINKCQSPKQLKEWNLLASKYPETKELYDIKLKQLINE